MNVRRRPLTPLDAMFRQGPQAYTPGSKKPSSAPTEDAPAAKSTPAKPEPLPDKK